MLVGSTMEAILFSIFLGFVVWLTQQVCKARRAIAAEFIAALLTGILVAFFASTGAAIPIWALCHCSHRPFRSRIVHRQLSGMSGL